MQAAKLPASAGWQWIRDGLALFRRQPLPIFTWAMCISLLLMISGMAPPIGPILFILLVPAISFLSLAICRHIATGRVVTPAMWLQPLQRPGLFKRLLGMGALYAGLGIAAGLLVFQPFMASLSDEVLKAALTALAESGDMGPMLTLMRTPLIIFTIVHVCIGAFFWYAPAVAGFFGTRLIQALFFSAVACWRNKTAFILYGLGWAAVFFAIDLAIGLMLVLGLPPALIMMIQIPLNVAAAAVLYCSVYPSYVSVFGFDAVQLPAADQPLR